ncbi:hypothetical protein T484DRAFT_1773068 [Baffinella frigidus]|nr:hypothetical protein T484DRAFT_1773068 [Cryptophyta sp. CCMP2293]
MLLDDVAIALKVDIALKMDIALKVVPIALRSGFEEVVEELVALYQSHHPHVAAFHGAAYNQSEQCMVIAFEYLDRKSLRDVLKTASTIPESIMACASAQAHAMMLSGTVLAGMIYLHRERRGVWALESLPASPAGSSQS